MIKAIIEFVTKVLEAILVDVLEKVFTWLRGHVEQLLPKRLKMMLRKKLIREIRNIHPDLKAEAIVRGLDIDRQISFHSTYRAHHYSEIKSHAVYYNDGRVHTHNEFKGTRIKKGVSEEIIVQLNFSKALAEDQFHFRAGPDPHNPGNEFLLGYIDDDEHQMRIYRIFLKPPVTFGSPIQFWMEYDSRSFGVDRINSNVLNLRKFTGQPVEYVHRKLDFFYKIEAPYLFELHGKHLVPSGIEVALESAEGKYSLEFKSRRNDMDAFLLFWTRPDR